ncbi:Txe/YoeB family addiction module toxin [Thiomicrospira sp. ALE5]|uniref:Txe/YoeB family addiction module toxin n=1 Tax=Thiomicrospira sp. ALE5 TaxID=748650 RepID=UPI0008EC9671|nr:Txe/YoeB family addiction module toxin [Thiomicrospira sp. ALE5]SFR63876.1 toxin YoeB [Thiomicrospira sp. ALE5]
MIISFTEKAWLDYSDWAVQDKKVSKRIQRLIQESLRDPYAGIGKPEPLKNNLLGYWSKRITDEHRLVYRLENENLIIISCRFHYQL